MYRAILVALAATFLVPSTHASTYVVNSTSDALATSADANPGNDICATSGGSCTLRAAIQEANAHAGADIITFSTQGIIVLESALPDITGQVTIDATTAPGYSASPAPVGTPSVVVRSNLPLTHGLSFAAAADNSSLLGLSVTGFAAANVASSGDNVTIRNNWLLGADDDGLALFGTGSIVGGDNTQGNLLSGNGRYGVLVGGSGHVLSGNVIGLGISGTSAYENTVDGVHIFAGAANITVGSPTPANGNVISGNSGNGIGIDGASNVTILGNRIGPNVPGNAVVPNALDGIHVMNANAVTIGPENVINGNLGDGINVASSGQDVEVTGNAIRNNGGLGIDLGTDGVTANDAGDGDSGANSLQNFPTITSVAITGADALISGTLNSTPSTTFTLRFYENLLGTADPSGHGEGIEYLGETTVTTDGTGNASFAYNTTGVGAGSLITATATGPAGTSEFGANVVAGAVAAQPSVEFNPVTYTVSEGGGTVTVTVTRTGDLTGTSSVNFSTANGTAVAGADYTASSGTLTFGAGVASQTFTIPVIDDLVVDAAETFTVTLSAPTGATLGANTTATITINDNDVTAPPPADVPTASEWALLVLAATLAGLAVVRLTR